MKSKWIYLTVEKDPDEIINSLLKCHFSEDKSYGFEVISIDNDEIEASYFEQITILDIFTLPDGRKIENKQIKIINFDFRLIKFQNHRYIIEISSPPRSIKTFIDKLELTLDKETYISNVQININKFITHLEESREIKNVDISYLAASNIKIDANNIADIQIKSRKSILESLNKVFDEQSYNFKSIHASFFYFDEKFKMKVSSNGGIESSSPNHGLIVDFLKRQETQWCPPQVDIIISG